MDDQTKKKYEAVDILKPVYTVLGWFGFCKLYYKPQNKLLRYAHKIYREFVFLLVFIYNLQHSIFTIQMFINNDMDRFIEGLMMAIPQTNLLCKLIFIIVGNNCMDKLHDYAADPLFSVNDEKEHKYIKDCHNRMRKITNSIMYVTTVCASFWVIGPIIKRMQDPETNPIPSYVPFETKSTKGFTLALLAETTPIGWIGYAHISVDILMMSYFSLAQTMLKIIKHNLVNLTDSTTEVTDCEHNGTEIFQYKDEVDIEIRKRFITCVKRYQLVVSYMKEIHNFFNYPITFQFFNSTFSVCFAVYNLSSMNPLSLQSAFLVLFLCLIQWQTFVVCFFGGSVEIESNTLVTSLYLSDWLSLSPKFRRDIIIAMTCWMKPISAKVSAVLPLSFHTFIYMVKSSYTLYTMLIATNK